MSLLTYELYVIVRAYLCQPALGGVLQINKIKLRHKTAVEQYYLWQTYVIFGYMIFEYMMNAITKQIYFKSFLSFSSNIT